MTIIADASVLVAELLRVRGRKLMIDPRLRVVVTEEQWSETRHELNRRLRHFTGLGHLTTDQIEEIRHDIQVVVDNAIEVVPGHSYEHMETVARRRVPRDANDWPTVALAIALGAGILTEDHDFLGCGCATWTFETLRDELAHRETIS